MKMKNKKRKIKPKFKLWHYSCSMCSKINNEVIRGYDRPVEVRHCSRCGSVMGVAEVSINECRKGVKIKLN